MAVGLSAPIPLVSVQRYYCRSITIADHLDIDRQDKLCRVRLRDILALCDIPELDSRDAVVVPTFEESSHDRLRRLDGLQLTAERQPWVGVRDQVEA